MDASKTDKSKLPSRHVTEGPERAPHRSYLYAMGLTREQIHQPLVGVASCWNEAAPCNISLMRQAQAVAEHPLTERIDLVEWRARREERDRSVSEGEALSRVLVAERFAEDEAYQPSQAPRIKPGSCFVKDWRGERHEVWVKEEGFNYRGRDFASLSQVAFAITGTKWNGPAFFGQRKAGRP